MGPETVAGLPKVAPPFTTSGPKPLRLPRASNVPLLTTVPPLKGLAAVRVRMPGPTLTRLPAPESVLPKTPFWPLPPAVRRPLKLAMVAPLPFNMPMTTSMLFRSSVPFAPRPVASKVLFWRASV